MLQDIEINNFRCFESTKISGLKRVNLIGGKNNAGKTAFLEALLLYNFPRPKSIIELMRIRRESLEISKSRPEKTWDNFFLDQSHQGKITISGRYSENWKTVELSVSDTIDSDFFEHQKDVKKLKEFIDFISQNESVTPLNIKVTQNQEKISKSSVFASSNGIISSVGQDSIDIPIIPSGLRMSNKELAESYDKARMDEKDSEVLKLLQILDSSIQEVDSFSIGEPTLYLRSSNKRRLPISLYGDAIIKATTIILKLINNNPKILLIDEIENGIHYTNQREFWRTLFRLSTELDTQIFATTHSLEMIQSFGDVGLEIDEEMSAYFELARHPKTNKIIGIKRDVETLKYALEHGKGVRGE
jgi:AAA15 family ATPase/GTPase